MRESAGNLGGNVLNERSPGCYVEHLNAPANRQQREPIRQRPARQHKLCTIPPHIHAPQQPGALFAVKLRRDVASTGENQAIQALKDSPQPRFFHIRWNDHRGAPAQFHGPNISLAQSEQGRAGRTGRAVGAASDTNDGKEHWDLLKTGGL